MLKYIQNSSNYMYLGICTKAGKGFVARLQTGVFSVVVRIFSIFVGHISCAFIQRQETNSVYA